MQDIIKKCFITLAYSLAWIIIQLSIIILVQIACNDWKISLVFGLYSIALTTPVIIEITANCISFENRILKYVRYSCYVFYCLTFAIAFIALTYISTSMELVDNLPLLMVLFVIESSVTMSVAYCFLHYSIAVLSIKCIVTKSVRFFALILCWFSLLLLLFVCSDSYWSSWDLSGKIAAVLSASAGLALLLSQKRYTVHLKSLKNKFILIVYLDQKNNSNYSRISLKICKYLVLLIFLYLIVQILLTLTLHVHYEYWQKYVIFYIPSSIAIASTIIAGKEIEPSK